MLDILIAMVVDFILGDPYSFPHPVRAMGSLIGFEDRSIRGKVKEGKKLRSLGFFVALTNIFISFSLGYFILILLRPYRFLYRFVKIYITYACIAGKSLDFEASKVQDALEQGLEKARYQLSFIVGRDTSNLTRKDIIKATIETVAENTSDGIIAPLFFIFLLGPPGGLMYKMVNTMDSMLGYKNEKYMDFGKWPALIDDLYNYIPARITGVLMCLSSVFKYDVKNGFRIMFRDRKNHASPNAGYPESAVAGLLGIELGGSNVYHGVLVEKPNIGDGVEPVEDGDIRSTIDIMYRTQALFFIIYGFIVLI